MGINHMSPGSGRRFKENNSTINTANAFIVGLNKEGVESYNQILDTTPTYTAKGTIVRGSGVATYNPGQMILGDGSTVLQNIDFSIDSGLDLANRKIAITSAYIASSNGGNNAFNGYIDLFNVEDPQVIDTIADYTIFNPTIEALINNFEATIDDISTTRKYGTSSNLSMKTEILRKCTLDVNGQLYIALIPTSNYTPSINENLSIILKFYLLN